MDKATDAERRYEELLGALLLAYQRATVLPEQWQQGEFMLGAVQALLDHHGVERRRAVC